MTDRLCSWLKPLIPRPIFRLLQPGYHLSLAALAAVGYGFPSRQLTVIGVTGTNGKTTVVHVLHEMLRSGGYAVGSISSLRFKVGEREEPNFLKMTMPGRFALQRFLAQCRGAGCRFVVVEVTSEGVRQYRHVGIHFSGAVLTNVTPEHIEAHGGFEAYREAKAQLFHRVVPSGWVVLNRADPSAAVFAERARAHRVWYSRGEIAIGGQVFPVRVGAVQPDHIELSIAAASASTGLGGEFNVENILAASATALAFGVSPEAIAVALNRMAPIPGRLEFVARSPVAVVVDYAHTPDALEKLYAALGGRGLVCVFGSAGGGRDKWKRPELGSIAAQSCKRVILTSEDPDDEDPATIAAEIQSGMTNGEIRMTKMVLDRREAIRQALRDALPGDTVVITGMGAQPWFIGRGGKRILWDDRAVVREELSRIKIATPP